MDLTPAVHRIMTCHEHVSLEVNIERIILLGILFGLPIAIGLYIFFFIYDRSKITCTTV